MSTTLRQSAEERIQNGTAPISRVWLTGIQALTLLHELASAPETASDALKLLHELQVHQVELDLQYDQIEQERRQVTEDLQHYISLFELAPFAYLTLNPEGLVIAANAIATDWLTAAPGQQHELAGRRIEDLLVPECHATVRDMLTALREGKSRQSCALQFKMGGASAYAVATARLGEGQVLMTFVPAAPGRCPPDIAALPRPAHESPQATG